ncbi:HET-domain-containing protein [Amniculicola lignicola CBS 123094]|uniref:HET-domain-containing protein n=1 Tax=Amniculicola lignicola CBS 123094 TaxID=1392246 RepID=A0A6A5W2Q4_9PLEO|nr:HET-domain-containing protein [Amniculicola lignicola CBS 123094]
MARSFHRNLLNPLLRKNVLSKNSRDQVRHLWHWHPPSRPQQSSSWWRKTLKRCLLVSGTLYLVGDDVHTALTQCLFILHHHGIIDAIEDATIFKVIPPKKIESTNPTNIELSNKGNSIYQPISRENEIRLSILEPGNLKDEVRCNLVNVQLDWRVRYDALSYAWGDAAIREPIVCCGQRITVTENLHSALHHLRDPTRPVYLWVDALCIQQADLEERSQQVKMMTTIYSSARQVLIWLGPSSPETADVLSTLSQLDRDFWPVYFRRWFHSSIGFLSHWGVGVFRPARQPVADTRDWAAVAAMLERPWFGRTWVLQEAILNRRTTVVLGHERIFWGVLERVCDTACHYSDQIEGFDRHINPKVRAGIFMVQIIKSARADMHALPYEFWREKEGSVRLVDLVTKAGHLNCVDPRDKVFGVRGLAENLHDGDVEVTPDYTIAVEEVFKRFVMWEIRKNGSLKAMGLSSNKQDSMLDLPSWVPDLSRLDDTLSFMSYDHRVNFTAAPLSTTLLVRHSENEGKLYVKGFLIDQVGEIGQIPFTPGRTTVIPGSEKTHPPSGLLNTTARHLWLRECLAITLATNKDENDVIPNDLWEAHWRTMCCNHDGNFHPINWTYEYYFKSYWELHKESGRTGDWDADINGKYFALIEQDFFHFCKGRRFCSTKGGSIGWVPESARSGDLVAVFHGGRVPYILRPCEGGYTFVGEAYVHDAMQGEKFLEAQGKGEAIEFALV